MKEESEKQVELARKRREAEEEQLRQEEQMAMQQGWYDDEAKQMAKEEREKLIKNYVAQVFDYMDAGQLTEEDIKILPQELQEKIAEMRKDRMFLQAGVAKEDRDVIRELPSREQVERDRRALEEKKRAYKSALPW